MADLREQVKTFLEAEGFTAGGRRQLVVGTRRTIGEDVEYMFVHVPEGYDPATFSSREAGLLHQFEETAKGNPTAPKFMIVPTLEGMSRAFSEGAAKWYKVKIRTPVQFFDTNFRWDTSPETASAARELRDTGDQQRRLRVSQPYSVPGTEQTGPDLLEALRHQLTNPLPKGKSIHIVTGPAGIGKSRLFEVLFADLHKSFMDYKARGGPAAPRPFPLIPEYLPLADSQTLRSLSAAYLQTDFVRPLRVEVFQWMVTNGFAVWMLDGLDQVISQDPRFFDYLLDLMTLPGAPVKPRVLLCARDSLLASNAAFRELCDEYSEDVALYRLAEWGTDSKRHFAAIALSSSAKDFMAALSQRPSLNTLASIPYYCNLLSQAFRADQLKDEYSETSLVQHALQSLLERDYDKGFIDRVLVEPAEAQEFLEAIASEDFAAGFRGVPTETVQQWARMVLPGKLPDEETERRSASMTNLGAFSHASPGYIRFSQEVLEQYLLGRYFVRLFGNSPEVFVRELARRELPGDSLAIRLVVEHIKRGGHFRRLKELLYQSVAHKSAFKNILQIAAMSADKPSALQDVPFERQDVSNLCFRDLHFQGVSFRGCNLTDTEFVGCNLNATDFDEAILRNTGFLSLSPDALRGAQIGDLAKFYSMRVERGRVVSNHDEARKWFHSHTGERARMVEPCGAALQLRYFFNKFVYVDGTARRSWLGRAAILAGKRFHPSPEDVLNAAIRRGYLREEEGYRHRIHRPDGDAYSEFVGFAANLKLTVGIKLVLDDVCAKESCPHIPIVE